MPQEEVDPEHFGWIPISPELMGPASAIGPLTVPGLGFMRYSRLLWCASPSAWPISCANAHWVLKAQDGWFKRTSMFK
jgi:hypothetical protein